MLINQIEPLDKRRCKVFLNGDFAFVLYRGELKRYNITDGGELPESVYEQILSEVIYKRTRERALHLLKFSSRTESELRRKLLMNCYPANAVDAAISFLKEYHYLDDLELARNYIEVYGAKKSRKELQSALYRKGVAKESVEQLLSEEEPDEEKQIRELLVKRHYFEEEDLNKQRKIINFLMRKGYSYGSIRHVIGLQDLDEFYVD